MKRKSWNEYFMSLAILASERSTCLRRKVGAVAVRNNKVIATGYNGPPSNLPHCDTIGCIREQLNIPSGEKHEICRAVHAEQNLIIQNSNLEGASIYCTHMPCFICAKMLINAGIEKIYAKEYYPDELALEALDIANIKIMKC